MVMTLAQNARGVCLNPALGAMFHIFHEQDSVQATRGIIGEPNLCAYVRMLPI